MVSIPAAVLLLYLLLLLLVILLLFAFAPLPPPLPPTDDDDPVEVEAAEKAVDDEKRDVVRRSSKTMVLYSTAPRKNAFWSGIRAKALLFSDLRPTQTLMLPSSSSGQYLLERSACASV